MEFNCHVWNAKRLVIFFSVMIFWIFGLKLLTCKLLWQNGLFGSVLLHKAGQHWTPFVVWIRLVVIGWFISLIFCHSFAQCSLSLGWFFSRLANFLVVNLYVYILGVSVVLPYIFWYGRHWRRPPPPRPARAPSFSSPLAGFDSTLICPTSMMPCWRRVRKWLTG